MKRNPATTVHPKIVRAKTETVHTKLVTPEGFHFATVTTVFDPEAKRLQTLAELMEIRKRVRGAYQLSAKYQQADTTKQLKDILDDLDRKVEAAEV